MVQKRHGGFEWAVTIYHAQLGDNMLFFHDNLA